MTEQKIQKAETELLSKKLQVGQRIYYLDLKENARGRFMKFVETLSMGRASRIVIPLSVADQFVAKLREVMEFKETYTPEEPPAEGQTEEQDEKKFAKVIKSWILSVLGRKFYFDLKETNLNALVLRISHVSNVKRVNISIFVDALSSLIDIMDEYLKEYPIVASPADATPVVKKPKKKFPKKNASPKVDSNGVALGVTTLKAVDTEKVAVEKPKIIRKPLEVSADPEPMSFTLDGRAFTFELVQGENKAFVRVCEQKNFKKTTLHIPIDICRQWNETLSSFVGKISEECIEATKALKKEAVETVA